MKITITFETGKSVIDTHSALCACIIAASNKVQISKESEYEEFVHNEMIRTSQEMVTIRARYEERQKQMRLFEDRPVDS